MENVKIEEVKKYFHYDLETGYSYEVTKEQYEGFQKAWKCARPQVEGIGRVLIFGTSGEIDSSKLEEIWKNTIKMNKQEYTMTEEELQAIYDISRNQEPVIFVGTWLGLESKQEKANKLWENMADKYGFIWDSVEPSGKDNKVFLATPKNKE